MELKFIILFLGLFIGFFCGLEGSTAPDHYAFGLTQIQEEYLISKSWLFKISHKLSWVTLILSSPVGFVPACIILMIIAIIFPEIRPYYEQYFHYVMELFAIYLGAMLLTYFIGYYKGEKIQTKYNVRSIK